LARTVQSVLAQTYAHYEIIIVDDGSTDDTAAVVKRLGSSRVRYYWKENGERAAARNFGTARATGDYVTFLDSDDLLYPDYLRRAAEAISTHASPPFLHLAYEVTDPQLKPKVKVDGLRSNDITILVKGNPLSCTGCFLRKDVAAAFRFNEDRALSGSEDWELWIRVVAHFGIKTDNRISSALIDHEARSVKSYPEEKLRKRKELALQYAFADPRVREKFGAHRQRIASYWDSYIALHLILAGKNGRGLRYFLDSLAGHPFSLFERRTLGITKHCLLNWVRPSR
jgi:glycosyltransferase involved in cell wall biosynthesis